MTITRPPEKEVMASAATMVSDLLSCHEVVGVEKFCANSYFSYSYNFGHFT